MPSLQVLSFAALACVAAAQDASSSTSSSAPSMETGIVTLPAEVINCHSHGTDIYCFAGEEEWEITSENAAEYDGEDLTECAAGSGDNEISCNAPDGTEITLLREGAEDGAEEDHDHAEEDHDHSHNNSTSTAIPTAVSNCHAHDEGIFCFADDEEWEITSENAASYEGQNLTACASSAMNTTTIECDSEDGEVVILAQEAEHDHSEEDHDDSAAGGANTTDAQNTTTTEETTDDEGAGSALVASVGFSVVGLMLAAFVL